MPKAFQVGSTRQIRDYSNEVTEHLKLIGKALQIELQSSAYGFDNTLEPFLCTDLKRKAVPLQNKADAYFIVPFQIKNKSTACFYRRCVCEMDPSFF